MSLTVHGAFSTHVIQSSYSVKGDIAPPGGHECGDNFRVTDERTGRVVADCPTMPAAMAALRLLVGAENPTDER